MRMNIERVESLVGEDAKLFISILFISINKCPFQREPLTAKSAFALFYLPTYKPLQCKPPGKVIYEKVRRCMQRKINR